MKNNVIKTIFKGALLLGVSLLLNISVKAQTVNFTGNWSIILEKSDFGGNPPSYAAAEFNITQDENSISFDRVIELRDSTTHNLETLKFDGSKTVTDLKIKIKEASIKWSVDKTSLVETATQKFSNTDGSVGQFQTIEKFSLTNDNNFLIYVREVKSPSVNFVIKAEYKKM